MRDQSQTYQVKLYVCCLDLGKRVSQLSKQFDERGEHFTAKRLKDVADEYFQTVKRLQNEIDGHPRA